MYCSSSGYPGWPQACPCSENIQWTAPTPWQLSSLTHLPTTKHQHKKTHTKSLTPYTSTNQARSNTWVHIFFLRLPIGQYGPVSQLSYPEKEKEAVQVHLIGAEPIVQVRTWNNGEDHSYRSLLKNKHKQTNSKTGTARHGNQEPPGQAPRCTGPEATNKENTRDLKDRSRYALTYIEMPWTML